MAVTVEARLMDRCEGIVNTTFKQANKRMEALLARIERYAARVRGEVVVCGLLTSLSPSPSPPLTALRQTRHDNLATPTCASACATSPPFCFLLFTAFLTSFCCQLPNPQIEAHTLASIQIPFPLCTFSAHTTYTSRCPSPLKSTDFFHSKFPPPLPKQTPLAFPQQSLTLALIFLASV